MSYLRAPSRRMPRNYYNRTDVLRAHKSATPIQICEVHFNHTVQDSFLTLPLSIRYLQTNSPSTNKGYLKSSRDATQNYTHPYPQPGQGVNARIIQPLPNAKTNQESKKKRNEGRGHKKNSEQSSLALARTPIT